MKMPAFRLSVLPVAARHRDPRQASHGHAEARPFWPASPYVAGAGSYQFNSSQPGCAG